MKKLCSFFIICTFICLACMIAVNIHVYSATKDKINKKDTQGECALILGAGVKNNQPTPMLEDRLITGIQLYKEKKVNKLIMSGDHRNEDYNEVKVMKDYAIQHGVPSSDIFMDHQGYSTYESLYRAKYVFQCKKVIIVTQDYHLYRALYIANQLDLNAEGVSASLRPYFGQSYREFRELIARTKDFIYSQMNYKIPIHESYPINGDGDMTNHVSI